MISSCPQVCKKECIIRTSILNFSPFSMALKLIEDTHHCQLKHWVFPNIVMPSIVFFHSKTSHTLALYFM